MLTSIWGLSIGVNIYNFPPMGRKQINGEATNLRLPEGTLARIEAVRDEKEPLAAFLREAVERYLRLRERKSK